MYHLEKKYMKDHMTGTNMQENRVKFEKKASPESWGLLTLNSGLSYIQNLTISLKFEAQGLN